MIGKGSSTVWTKALRLVRQPVVGFGLALIVLTWVGAAGLILQEMRSLKAQRAQDADNLSLILQQNVRETIGGLDQTLISVRAMEAHDDYKPKWSAILAEDHFVESDAVQLAVTDEKGLLVSSSLDLHPTKSVDLSDRRHFLVQAEATRDQLYIGPVVTGRVSKKSTVQISRRRLSRDGRFAGVIVISLPADYFDKDFANLDLGDGGLALVGDDGWVRAGNGGFRALVGQRMDAKAVAAQGAPDDFVSVRPVGSYPLEVIARLPGIGDDPLWRDRREMFLGLALTLSILAVIVTFNVARRRARYEEAILFMSRHDALTGLPNRVSLVERLEQLCASPEGEVDFALHMIDLDRFKFVNDTYGHAIGDELLRAVAVRLHEQTGPLDLVARLGGDEFAVIQRITDTGPGPAALAKRLCMDLARPVSVARADLVIGGTVGFAHGRRDGHRAAELLKAADLALYAAKSRERGSFQPYDRSMTERIEARLRIETGLRAALELGEFEVAYQPIKSLANEQTLGYEALLRWRRDGKDVAPPGEFIPIAEDMGLIVEIGAWILNRACAEIAARPERPMISVNASPLQFEGSDYVGFVKDVLARTGLAPERLQIEITETMMLEDRPRALEQLRQLRALGVKVAIDDFGTGYSCLSYLEIYPIDTLKIDRQFVNKLGERKEAGATLRAIVDLAASFGIETIAEGVETHEQWRLLLELGCRKAQGYLLGRPGRLPDASAPAALTDAA